MKRWEKLTICTDPAYLHPVLRAKVAAVIRDVQGHFDAEDVQFRLFETGRSAARQQHLLAQGVSRTLQSKHLTGRAADIVPYIRTARGTWTPTWDGELRGRDGRTWTELLTASATAHGLDRVWFRTRYGKYVDGPHVQLRKSVPDEAPGW